MTQRWYELDEFPDYGVNDLGEIFNLKTGMQRKTGINQYGIVKISLYKGKELHTRSVAVLVADAFVEGKTEFFNTPIHLDGDKENCRAENLMWRPRWAAVQYHRQFEVVDFHHMDVHLEHIQTGKEYYSVKDVCMDLGLYYQDVYRSYVHDRQVPLTGDEFLLLE